MLSRISNRPSLGFDTLSSVVSLSRVFSTSFSPHYNLVIVGGGIVGLATARSLLSRQKRKSPTVPLRLLVVEKESYVGAHQSSHNSGVLHAGIYYSAHSLRAELCQEGIHRLYEYCQQKGIQTRKTGKIIVAVDKSELDALDVIHARGKANGVPGLKRVSGREIKEKEPLISNAMEGIYSPHTGIVNFHDVCKGYLWDIQQMGGDIHTDFHLGQAEYITNNNTWRLTSLAGAGCPFPRSITTDAVVTCTGLHSDSTCQLFGDNKYPPIVPFRGRWYYMDYNKAMRSFPSGSSGRPLISHNIYPVPNKDFPFLGIHFTPLLTSNNIMIGPTASLAFAREGYEYSQIDIREMMRIIGLSTFRAMAWKHWKFGITQWMTELYPQYLLYKDILKYIPSFKWEWMQRRESDQSLYHTSGVRAQVLGEDGKLIEDFLMEYNGKGVLHVRNAPSPAATASLAIGERIAQKAENSFGW